MTREQWDDFGAALTKVLLIFILILTIILVIASLATAPARAMRPDTLVLGPSWKDCSEMIPMPQANDDSMIMVCTRADNGKRYEIVYRPVAGSRTCTEVVTKPDGYQHFMCGEKFELMVRLEKK